MADEPILCFDGDEAGMKAALRAVELALPQLEPGKSLRFALLPEGRDPDDLVKSEGAEGLRRALQAAKPLVDMLWFSASRGTDLSTPERRAGLERTVRQAVATIRNSDIRRHYEIAMRESVERHFGASRQPRRGPARHSGRYRTALQPPPSIPSASLLANRLVHGRGDGSTPSLRDALLLGAPILRPEIGAERLEPLAELSFAGRALSALAAAIGAKLAESPEMTSSELRAALEREGHGKAVAGVLTKLRNSGLGSLSEELRERVAAAWDEAAHLRLRGGTLSIERQALASALGREASEVHLSRLRDIQEQDQRGLRPDIGDETEAAMIVHPFKRR
jgi:DNA primase